MDSIELVRDNLRKSRERVLERIEEMRDHCFVFPTPQGGAHTLWVLGHLAYIEGLVVRSFMLGTSNPLESWKSVFDGDETPSAESSFPPFDEVLEQCHRMRDETLGLVDSFAEKDLDRQSMIIPDRYEEMFGTYRHCLQFVADHWYMHRGQLADARRAAGLHRMGL